MLKHISRLGLLVLATCIVILALAPKDPSGYYGSFAAKYDSLALVKPPRLILVGGSNVAMGIDSELLEKRLGVRPVNMGINGGVGLRFMLDRLRPWLRTGDRVVIVPEYEQMTGTFDGDINLARTLLVSPQEFANLHSCKQYLAIAYNIPLLVQLQFGEWLAAIGKTGGDPVYNRNAYNRYGDMISHLGRTSEKVISTERLQIPRGGTFANDFIAVLNDFYRFAAARGVSCCLAFPCLAETAYEDGRSDVESIYHRLQQESAMPLLSEPKDDVYPASYFYDTIYHLTAQGRQLRSTRLATRIAVPLQ